MPTKRSVIAAGVRALDAYIATSPLGEASCSWTDSTLLLGAVEFYKASNYTAALQGAEAWARKQGYRLCGAPKADDRKTFMEVRCAESGTASGDDSCRVAVQDVEYAGSPSGKPFAASTFAECCERCGALGYPRCSYFTFAGGQCSLQTTNTAARRSLGALSGWPSGGPCPPQCRHVAGGVRGPHGANSQLCGATYIELALLTNNVTLVEHTAAVLAEEVADPVSVSYWSWVDAFFMSMNTYARLGAAAQTPRPKQPHTPGTLAQDHKHNASEWFEKQWTNFHQAALAPPNNLTSYGLWNKSTHLFYRDSRFVGTEIFWGRGNAWAIGALVAAIRFGEADPHRPAYVQIFQQHASRLCSIIGSDGAWRPSLLHPADYPAGETTATAGIIYGLAFGLNQRLLTPRATYLGAVLKGWKFLTTTALQSETPTTGSRAVLLA
eukprot:COSAG02_NODE_2562_length_8527_cov_24.422995_1_plen_438_part_00